MFCFRCLFCCVFFRSLSEAPFGTNTIYFVDFNTPNTSFNPCLPLNHSPYHPTDNLRTSISPCNRFGATLKERLFCDKITTSPLATSGTIVLGVVLCAFSFQSVSASDSSVSPDTVIAADSASIFFTSSSMRRVSASSTAISFSSWASFCQ